MTANFAFLQHSPICLTGQAVKNNKNVPIKDPLFFSTPFSPGGNPIKLLRT
jgi:hypothetical protein